MTTIELKQYTYFPNVKKMQNDLGDNYDYICFGCEIVFIPENFDKNKKAETATFISYLPLDHYQGKTTLNLDFLSVEDTGSFYYSQIATQKIKKKKEIIIQQVDNIVLKTIPTKTNLDNIKNFSELMDNYFKNDLEENFSNMNKFFNNHNIEYCPKQLNEYMENVQIAAKIFFSPKNLNEFLENKIKEINSLLLFKELHNNLNTNPISIKKKKI
jgi:hypothetical protein